MVGSDDPIQRVAMLQAALDRLRSEYRAVHEELIEAKRRLDAYETSEILAMRSPVVETALDAALKIPDILNAIMSLLLHTEETWARDSISLKVHEAFRRRRDKKDHYHASNNVQDPR